MDSGEENIRFQDLPESLKNELLDYIEDHYVDTFITSIVIEDVDFPKESFKLLELKRNCDLPVSANEIWETPDFYKPSVLISSSGSSAIIFWPGDYKDLYLMEVEIRDYVVPPKVGRPARQRVRDHVIATTKPDMVEITITQVEDIVQDKIFSHPDLITDYRVRSNRIDCRYPQHLKRKLVDAYNSRYSHENLESFKFSIAQPRLVEPENSKFSDEITSFYTSVITDYIIATRTNPIMFRSRIILHLENHSNVINSVTDMIVRIKNRIMSITGAQMVKDAPQMDSGEINISFDVLPDKLKVALVDYLLESKINSTSIRISNAEQVGYIMAVRQLPTELRCRVGGLSSNSGYLVSREALRFQEENLKTRKNISEQRLDCRHPLSLTEVTQAYDNFFPMGLMIGRGDSLVVVNLPNEGDKYKVEIKRLNKLDKHLNVQMIPIAGAINFTVFSRPDLLTDYLIRSNRAKCGTGNQINYLLADKYNIYYSKNRFEHFVLKANFQFVSEEDADINDGAVILFLLRVIMDYVITAEVNPLTVERELSQKIRIHNELVNMVRRMIGDIKKAVMNLTGAVESDIDPFQLIL